MFSSGSRLRGTWRKDGCFGPESRMEGLIPKEDPATGGKNRRSRQNRGLLCVFPSPAQTPGVQPPICACTPWASATAFRRSICA